jgi:HAD superfamily hydrolase (TIGR01509 family)
MVERKSAAVQRRTAIGAILFDLDGVLTPTAELHRQAWRDVIGGFFTKQGVSAYTEDDYFRYIDGKPRFEGVESVLGSRGLTLPLGSSDDPPGHRTIGALGNLKNAQFQARLTAGAVRPYPGTEAVLEALTDSGKTLAVVSSSNNAVPVLESARLLGHFELIVDGLLAREQGLAGKPEPDTYLYAADRLGFLPAAAAVVEDAISGVEAGRSGAFGLVVGVDRGVGRLALHQAGASVVIEQLSEMLGAI